MNSKIRNIFLTFFGAGLSPIAPGTVGTLAALPFGYALLYYFGIETLALFTILITFVGIKETDKYEAAGGEHDNGKIVIDEVVGVWLTLCMVQSIEPVWLQATLAFATFRLFDIWKPSVIGRIDRNMSGGKGVMLDDIAAGLFAGILSLLLYKVIFLF
ncbi:MAG: hypothetical protein RL154_1251 [Pseudomonadota bacterium]|jgi:phosphatidylglycerophosphatase A